MPKSELEGLPVIDADERISQDDLETGDPKDPEQHPIAIALRRQAGVMTPA